MEKKTQVTKETAKEQQLNKKLHITSMSVKSKVI